MKRPLLIRASLVASLVVAIALGFPTRQLHAAKVGGEGSHHIKAVAFDYLVLFNPDSVVDDVEQVFPGKGREFTNLWRTRQFEYTWLRSAAHRYVDFSSVTEDALTYAANATNLTLSADARRRLLNSYLHLRPWPDTVNALRRLHASGIKVITITNFAPAMLRANAENAGVTGLFDALLSTDTNRTYKPDPRAYQLGVTWLHVPRREIVFAAFGGWDAAGAKSFGYPTVWVNRFNQPAEELGLQPDATVSDLDGLLDFVRQTRHE
jgi:2-haloacid dehalogenase